MSDDDQREIKACGHTVSLIFDKSNIRSNLSITPGLPGCVLRHQMYHGLCEGEVWERGPVQAVHRIRQELPTVRTGVPGVPEAVPELFHDDQNGRWGETVKEGRRGEDEARSVIGEAN